MPIKNPKYDNYIYQVNISAKIKADRSNEINNFLSQFRYDISKDGKAGDKYILTYSPGDKSYFIYLFAEKQDAVAFKLKFA